jgi:two-component sensor histidine kinase
MIRDALVGLGLGLALLLTGPAAGQSAAPALADTAQVRAQLAVAKQLLARRTDSALVLNRQLLRASERLRYPYGLAQSYLQLGIALRNHGEFDASLAYGRRAQALFEAQHRPGGVAAVLNMEAQTYKRLGDAQSVTLLTRKGLALATRSLAVAQQASDLGGVVAALLTQGILYRDLHQPDSARRCYQRAIALEHTRHPTPSMLGVAYANYGQLLMDFDHNLVAAIRYFQQAVALHRASRNRNGLEHAYRQLSWAYRQQGRPGLAMVTADSCLVMGRASGDPHRLSNSLEANYLAYKTAGRYREANALLEEKQTIDNQLGRLEKTQAVTRIEAAYRLEKQQARIRALDLLNTHRQRQLAALGLGLALLGGLLLLTAWQYRALRRANTQLRETNQTIRENQLQLQAQASRLTLLLRELHHRVKNNLAIVSSLLNLQSGSLTDARAAQAVREGRQRVEAMSLLHQHLYQTADVAHVDMRPYLTTLLDNLLTTYGFAEDCFVLDLTLDLPPLEVERAIPLGLILNELVTNALKHAYADVARPWLRILLLDTGAGQTGLLLEVEDNGPGIAAGQWQKAEGSFGQQLILALSTQVGGHVTVANQPGAFFQLRLTGSSPANASQSAHPKPYDVS